jgi:hypothetical protein
MTVGPSLSQHDQNTHQIEVRQRLERLRAFSPDQLAAGLIWLWGYDQQTFDAVLDAAEPCARDEDPSGSDPEPVCGICGKQIGIFLRLNWTGGTTGKPGTPASRADRPASVAQASARSSCSTPDTPR